MTLRFHITTTDNMNLVMLSIKVAGTSLQDPGAAALQDMEAK